MNAERMKEILKAEYGISNENDFLKAIENSSGLNIGIFTMPINGGTDEKNS